MILLFFRTSWKHICPTRRAFFIFDPPFCNSGIIWSNPVKETSLSLSLSLKNFVSLGRFTRSGEIALVHMRSVLYILYIMGDFNFFSKYIFEIRWHFSPHKSNYLINHMLKNSNKAIKKLSYIFKIHLAVLKSFNECYL